MMLLLLTLVSQSNAFAVETNTIQSMPVDTTAHQSKYHSNSVFSAQQMDTNSHSCCKTLTSLKNQSKCQQSGSCSSGHCLSSVVLPTSTSPTPLSIHVLNISQYSAFIPSHPSSIPYRPPIIG
ncbi:hypothetical protein [Zooshikella harenae]|uniref:Uncharacterized protein n=1 Tax=Zooshikella harenae TaxID=2827238 RepID=A0ABS5ZH25_9GAMM|nr:hypothetical protein [Zooshikella harenae]MBU2713363.1 hypothetical protein [Zooshikella harenae]